MKEINGPDGSTIYIMDDGGITVKSKSGATYSIDKNGNAHIDLKTIAKIGIENITGVQSHRIMRQGDLTVHEIVFQGDGKVKLTYTANGHLKEFSGNSIAIQVSPDNSVLLKGSSPKTA